MDDASAFHSLHEQLTLIAGRTAFHGKHRVPADFDQIHEFEDTHRAGFRGMLGNRYQYDGVPSRRMNALQWEMKEQIDRKVENGTYAFEKVACCVCDAEEFDALAGKDRYGLYFPVAICRRCGLIQTNPRMNQRSYNEFYNAEYRKLYGGTHTATHKFFRSQHGQGRRIFDYVSSNGVLPKSAPEPLVLEVGCGAGGILQYFRERGCSTVGVDLGEEYVDFGKAEFGLDLSVGDLNGIKLGRLADVVIYCHVFEHILNLAQELRRIHEVLAPEGILYIEAPGVKNLVNSYNGDFLLLLQNAHTYHFSLTSLDNVLARNGFERLLGTEDIYAVFRRKKAASAREEFISDYGDVLRYLNRIERRRKVFHCWEVASRQVFLGGAIKLLKLTGLYNVARNLHRKLRQTRTRDD